MKKHIAKFSLLTLCAAAVFAAPASSSAQAITNTPATPVKKPAAAPSSGALSFHGVLTAVDTNAMTLTIEKRTFNMTSETIVIRNDKPAVLAEGAVGDQVGGTYKKNAGGTLDAITVRFSNSAEIKAKKGSSGN